MRGPNQISRKREEVHVTAKDLLPVRMERSRAGLGWNIDVGCKIWESLVARVGCVSDLKLMEDAATAEICRTQLARGDSTSAKLETAAGHHETRLNQSRSKTGRQGRKKVGEFANQPAFGQMMTERIFRSF